MIRALLAYSCTFGIRAILSTIREVIAQAEEHEQFRHYVADCLWAIAKNTANSFGGTWFEARYAESRRDAKKQDNRTGDEIVADIIARAGLEVIGT